MGDQYKELAKKALNILEIKYKNDAQLDELIKLLETSFSVVCSKTEIEIHRIVRTLAEMLRNREDIGKIKRILKNLEDNYLFSKYWD